MSRDANADHSCFRPTLRNIVPLFKPTPTLHKTVSHQSCLLLLSTTRMLHPWPMKNPTDRVTSHTSMSSFQQILKTPTDYLCRKKFLKLRHKFKDKMRDSNRLFDEEQHAMRLARRLQEQNEYYSPPRALETQLLIVSFAVSSSTSFSMSTNPQKSYPTSAMTSAPQPQTPPLFQHSNLTSPHMARPRSKAPAPPSKKQNRTSTPVKSRRPLLKIWRRNFMPS